MTYYKYKRALIMMLVLFSITANCACGKVTDSCFPSKMHDIFYKFSEKYPSEGYYILSERYDTCTIVTLGTSGSSYPKNFVDYYLIQDDKLIIYYSVDSVFDKSIIDTDKMQKYNGKDIQGFDGVETLSNCQSYSETHYFSNNSDQKELYPSHFTRFPQQAKANNAFLNQNINKKLNEFINSHDMQVTEMHFFRFKRELYVAFYCNYYYDKNFIDAYFYRNQHFVAIYGLDHIPPAYINRAEIKDYTGSIEKIRRGNRSMWLIPSPSIFKIVKGRLINITDENLILRFIFTCLQPQD